MPPRCLLRHLIGALAAATPLAFAGLTGCARATTAPAPAPEVSSAERPQYPSTYQRHPSAPVLIRNATLLTAAGPEQKNASILFADGKIMAIGADVAAPPDATVVDGTGKFVTPGIIDTHSHMGVYAAPGSPAESDGNEATNPVTAQVWAEHSFWPQDPQIPLAVDGGRWITPGFIQTGTTLGIKLLESGGLAQTEEDSVTGAVNAAFNVAEAIDPASLTLPVARLEGVTSTLAVPTGGLVPGQGVLFDLAGDRLDDLLVKAPAVVVMDLSEDGKTAGGGSRAGAVQRLRRTLRDALEYSRRKGHYRRGQIQPLAAPAEDLEALQSVVRGELPVLTIANRRSDIENALRMPASSSSGWSSGAAPKHGRRRPTSRRHGCPSWSSH